MFNDKYCENCNFATSYEFNKKFIYEKSVIYFIYYSQQEFQKLVSEKLLLIPTVEGANKKFNTKLGFGDGFVVLCNYL